MNLKLWILPLAVLFGAGLATAQVSVIGELSQDREARPGEQYNGTITVKNDTNEPQEAKAYQTDYLFFSNGTNRYDEPGTTARSNAKWITFSPAFMTIPPQGTVVVNFTVNVPNDQKLAGSYWSMLMVEGIPQSSPESSRPMAKKKTEMGIMQTIRYGIQIATHIANTGERKIEFKDPKVVTKGNEGRVFQVDILNTGTLGIRPEVYLELFNAQGASMGRFPGVRYRIYPGTSVRQTIDVSNVPKGSYKALVVVDAGGEDIFGAQYNLQF